MTHARPAMNARRPSPHAVSRWEKAGWVFLFVFAAADLFSISIAQIAAAGMTVCWIGRWVASGRRPDLSPLKWPFVAFMIASLIAATLSIDPVESWRDSRDLFHILIFFVAFDMFRRRPDLIGAALRVVTATGGMIAVVGLVQAARRGVDIYDRISGFNDMYMTYAGLSMLAAVFGLAILLFDFKKPKDLWVPFAIALIVIAVLLSLTRNAWIGLLAGTVALLTMKRPLALIAVPVVAAIVLSAAPSEVRARALSVFDPWDTSNRERLYLWSAGFEIIRDNPLFGVGQNSFPKVYPKYRRPEVAEPAISHLHNNLIEIAAERGLVGLAAWLSIFVYALWLMVSAWITRPDDGASRAALAAGISGATAFLTAGMFEYNFGDSEVQMLVCFVLAAATAVADERKNPVKIIE